MKKIKRIIEEFDASIISIDVSNTNSINGVNQKIIRTKDCLNKLRQEVKKNGFESPKDEIYFFKKQKPYIKGRLKFYISVNTYYFEKPKVDKSKIRKFINLELSKIRNENCKYNHFINYYMLNKTKNDKTYFLRGVDEIELFIDNTTYNYL